MYIFALLCLSSTLCRLFFIPFLHSVFLSLLLYLCFPFSPVFYLFVYLFYLLLSYSSVYLYVSLCLASFEQLADPGAGHLKLHTNIESVDVTVLCLICSRGCPLRVPGRKQNDWFLLSWRTHI